MAQKTKYKVGDWVYSWQNTGSKARITRIERGKDGYPDRYILTMYDRPDGYPRNLKATTDSSLTMRRTRAWLREYCPRQRKR